MLDRFSLKLARPFLQASAEKLHHMGVSANTVSFAGFILGIGGAAAIALHQFNMAIVLILLNRLADGVDGPLARIEGPTDRGAFLDITLDFIFYSAVVFGFCLADPINNSLAGAALIFSFIGTGSSFLAYAIMAERRRLQNIRLPDKGFYYLAGLAEGTETILFFILCCLFPVLFPPLAWVFFAVCVVSTVLRVIHAYRSLT